MRRILDAWALLAWLQNEGSAAGKMQRLLDRTGSGEARLAINVVNVGEVYYRLARKRGREEAQTFIAGLGAMGIDIIPAPNSLVLEAADLKSRYSISYADAFAAATAIRERAPLVTGDPELASLSGVGQLDIEWLVSPPPSRPR